MARTKLTPIQKNTLLTLLALGILFFLAACGDLENPFAGDDSAIDTTGNTVTENAEEEYENETDSIDYKEDNLMETQPEEPVEMPDENSSNPDETETATNLPKPPSDGDAPRGGRMFRVILASVSESRAQKTIEQLNDPQAEIVFIEPLNTYRVVYRSFENLRDAQNAAQAMEGKYPGTWIDYF